jgi:hypothetical protein
MLESSAMQKLCQGCIRNITLSGCLYAVVPVLLAFGGTFGVLDYRPVQVLRMVLARAARRSGMPWLRGAAA